MRILNEIIIVGGGISGLTAAALLSKQGHAVTLLEGSREWGGCAGKFQRGKHLFPVGATLGMGLEEGGIHQRIFEYLQVNPPESHLLDEVMSVHLHGRRLVFYRDRDKHVAHLQSHFPHCASDLARFYALVYKIASRIRQLMDPLPSLPPKTPGEWAILIKSLQPGTLTLLPYINRTMGGILASFGLHRHPDFHTFIDGQLIDSMQTTSDECSFLLGCLALDMYHQGAFYVDGGLYRMAEELANSAEVSGALLKRGKRVENICKKQDRWQVEDHRGNQYEGSHVIFSAPIEALLPLMNEESRDVIQRVVERKRSDRSWGTMTLYFVLDEGKLPDGLTLFQQICTGSGMSEGEHLFLSLSSRKDRLRSPSGFRTMTVSTHTDLSKWETKETYDAYKRELHDKMLSVIEGTYPGFSESIVDQYPGAPRAWERFTGRPDGMVGGYPQTTENALFHSVSHRTPLDGLWLCGDSVFPGAGTIGVSVSAYHVCRSITGLKLP
ncbi:FAD-dependent oxidoreductase [Rossellomorea marisflavi]